jgi:hypothetical protein
MFEKIGTVFFDPKITERIDLRSSTITKKAFDPSDVCSVAAYCCYLLSEAVKHEGGRIWFHVDGSAFVSHHTDKPIYYVRYCRGFTSFYQEFLSHDELLFEIKGPAYSYVFHQMDDESYKFLCRLFNTHPHFISSCFSFREHRKKLKETLEAYYESNYDHIVMFPDSNGVELDPSSYFASY